MMDDFRKWFIKYNPIDGEIQLRFLDDIDLMKYIEGNDRISKVMEDVEDVYDYGPFRDKIPSELHGCAFNAMSQEEFAEYLLDRYGDKYDVTYREIYDSWIEIKEKNNGADS